MNYSSRKILHPLGIQLQTPLLIPSYSSKGFAIDNGKSELSNIMLFAQEFIYESQLISAYDIYHRYISQPHELNPTQITFIDSGGYETSTSFDLSETRKYNHSKKEWNVDLLTLLLDKWSELHPAVIINYDDVNIRVSIDNQIENAHVFFNKRDTFLFDFLIKPETDNSDFVNIDGIIERIHHFSSFDILGLTEKELGESLAARMQNIFRLRSHMNEKGILSPIHIFGALDPFSVILYFIMGAEIFDGLSWLKYDFGNRAACYFNNTSVLKDTNNMFIANNELRLNMIKDNIYTLETLKNVLINFSINENFDIFDEIGGLGFGKQIEKIISNLKL